MEADKHTADRDRFVAWNRADKTPLMLAASHGRRDVIQLLLKYGAKPSLINSRNETALHFAAASPVCMEECISALVGEQVGPGRAVTSLLNMQVFCSNWTIVLDNLVIQSSYQYTLLYLNGLLIFSLIKNSFVFGSYTVSNYS